MNLSRMVASENPKRLVLGAIAGLLLLFAGMRVWSVFTTWSDQKEVNKRMPTIQNKITTHVGFPRKQEPFEELGLTDAQRQKFDALLTANMTTVPSAASAGGGTEGKAEFTRTTVPLDKILAILTPEQRRKLTEENHGKAGIHGLIGKMPDGLPPLPAGGGGMIILRKGAGGSPPALPSGVSGTFVLKGGPESSH